MVYKDFLAESGCTDTSQEHSRREFLDTQCSILFAVNTIPFCKVTKHHLKIVRALSLGVLLTNYFKTSLLSLKLYSRILTKCIRDQFVHLAKTGIFSVFIRASAFPLSLCKLVNFLLCSLGGDSPFPPSQSRRLAFRLEKMQRILWCGWLGMLMVFISGQYSAVNLRCISAEWSQACLRCSFLFPDQNRCWQCLAQLLFLMFPYKPL